MGFNSLTVFREKWFFLVPEYSTLVRSLPSPHPSEVVAH
jgi:hypothetical protein